MGDAVYVEQAEVTEAPLDITDIRPVDTNFFRQSLLGQAAGDPEPSDGLPEGDEEFGSVTLRHRATLVGPQTMGLQTMSGECKAS